MVKLTDMTNQPWMIIKPVTADIFYLWNGNYPILIINLTSKGDAVYGWGQFVQKKKYPKAAEITEEDRIRLNLYATDKRKNGIIMDGIRFRIMERGVLKSN